MQPDQALEILRHTARTDPSPGGGRPRVLYLAFYFPPSRASGVFRARATANHLAEAGWDVTVLTAPRKFFTYYLGGAADETLEGTVDPGIRVIRPGMNSWHWETDIRRFSRLRRNFPTLAEGLQRATQKWIFAEPYLGWAPAILRTALNLHLRQKFDLVLATGNPFISFAAAWALGRTLRIPYVVDYRDAWTFNQFTEEMKFAEGSKMLRWEARVLRDAAEAVFVNDGMRRWHAERYPYAADRMAVVPNGWEPEILGRPEFRVREPDQPLRFAYLGTVTPYLPLDDLFEGWRRARSHPLLADAELNIHGYLGFFSEHRQPLRARLEAEEDVGVHYLGPFGKTDAAAVYAQTDGLVFCVPGARFVTSGKVFEYMASGKPIVSVHRAGIAAADVLNDYPLWFSGASFDAETIAQSFIAAAKAARDLDRPTFDAALAHANRYTRDATLRPWETRLRKLVEERR